MKHPPIKDNMINDIRKALLEKNDIEMPAKCTADEIPNDDPVILFTQKYTEQGGLMYYSTTEEEIMQQVRKVQMKYGDASIGCCNKNLTEFLRHLGIENVGTASRNYTYRIGALLCEGLIAENGSLAFSSTQNFGSLFPTLPEVTLAIAFTAQVMPTWETLVNRIKDSNTPFPSELVQMLPGAASSQVTNLHLLLIEDL